MKSKKTLKIGRSDFGLIVRNNHYFVDKTELIYEFYNSANDVVLMPRPKRFGKTLNLSMIAHFFDIQKPENKELFTEYKISEHKEFCAEHQNKYPVINLSLKGVKAGTWDECLDAFKSVISNLYKQYKFLLNSEKIDEDDKLNFKNIINKTANITVFKESLCNLSKYLEKHFNKEVIILTDEYDAPIINAFNNTSKPIKSPDKANKTYYEKVISFMQKFLGDAYKGNLSLKKGLLTGVLKVGKESIFSEWNNFSVYGISSAYFSDSFGFTENEIDEILTYFDLQSEKENVRKWYDGYRFGNLDNIYNPWSIVNYISRTNDGFKPYWVNSGDYSLIKSRITEVGVKQNVQDLIEGKIIEKQLHENFVFQDFERNTELIWSLLTDNGYLTQVGKAKYGNYKLRIPNYEVRIVFTDIIMGWLNEEVKITRDLLISTSEHLVNNRISDFEKGFKKIVGDTLSYYDISGKNTSNEQIYHVYTLGLLAILSDDYIIKSNRESGEGRYDIMLIPYDRSQNGIVIELKTLEFKSKPDASQINAEIDKALAQIEANQYYKELLDNKIAPEKIIKLPIVFVGKEPYVCKL